MKNLIGLKSAAIEEGKLLEEDGLGFNRYYAEQRLIDGKRIFHHEFDVKKEKHSYTEVMINSIQQFPINDKSGYISTDFFTLEMLHEHKIKF